MKFTGNIRLRETLHGHGAKGMAFYGYADTDGLGVRMEARRKDGRSAFIETWFFDGLPGREFASFAELGTAVEPMTEADIAAVSAGYQAIRSVKPDSCGNRCRLCPRDPSQTGPYSTWRVDIAYSWKDIHGLSLCDEHLEQYQSDAPALKLAIEAEVAERRARAEARKEGGAT